MIRKRGILLVVLIVFFLIFFSSFSVFGYEINNNKYVSLMIGENPDDDDSGDCENYNLICDDINDAEGTEVGCVFKKEGDWPNFFNYGAGGSEGDTNECTSDLKKLPRYSQPASQGCWVFVSDDDGTGDDDCGFARVKEGFFMKGDEYRDLNALGGQYVRRTFESEDDYNDWKENGEYDSDEEINSYCMLRGHNYRLDTADSYICTDDHYWHQCAGTENTESTQGDIGSIVWVNNKVYNCTLDNIDFPIWKVLPGTDFDHDGYTTSMNDCDDDSSQDPEYCSDLETPEDCGEGNVLNAKCAICINPGMEEICGDTFDNDCNAETSEDCHKNKEACEESFIAGIPVEEAPPAEDGTEPAAVPGSNAYNIYHESFSWINTDDGGYCCGYDGINDLGTIKEDKDGSGTYLCLNEEKSLVGYEDAVASVFNPSDADPSGTADRCLGQWCWINAEGGPPAGAQFSIFTIKKPGEQPYDIVSNSQEWSECSSTTPNIANSVIIPENKEIANRFQCYQEGNRWSWAE